MGSKPKTPREDPASIALRKRQAEQLLQLDEDANTRIKRMFSASQGLRVGRGLSGNRLPAGDSAMGAEASNYGVEMSNARGYSGGRNNRNRMFNGQRKAPGSGGRLRGAPLIPGG